MHAPFTRIRACPLCYRITLVIRVLLAAGFLPTGLIKLLGYRFTSLPADSGPIGAFFEAMYQTGTYWQFIGAVQITGALLLLLPPAAHLGAAIVVSILTNIVIFSVDIVRHQDSADASKASAKPENVSLLVTPQQAQTLSYATQNGQLQLTLRSTTDDVAVETTEIDDEAFEGIDTDEGVKVSEEDPAEPAPTKVSNTQMSGTEQDRLKAFLNPNVPAPSESVPMPSMDTPPAAPKNTWSITIYDGEEKRVETLEIVPEREAPDTEPAKSEPTASAATPEKSGGADVGSWLRRLISEPKTKTDKSKTTQQAAPNLELPAEAKAS